MNKKKIRTSLFIFLLGILISYFGLSFYPLLFSIISIVLFWKGLLKNASSFLSKLDPEVYGFIYILVIPIYALIYSEMDQYSFYHSTYQYENDKIEEQFAPKLSKNLQELISGKINSKYDTIDIYSQHKYVKIEDYFLKTKLDSSNDYLDSPRIIPYEVNFNDLTTKNQNLSFTVQFDYADDTCLYCFHKNLTLHLKISTDVNKDFDRILTLDSISVNSNVSDIVISQSEKSRIIQFGKRLFDNSIKSLDNSNSSDVEAIHNAIEPILEARGGKASASSTNFERMLYFSIMTITTTGYGDIVPLTQSARLIVGSEAIVGVILVGLFLNSLSNKIFNNQNKAEK